MSSIIIEHFIADIVNNSRNRFCYLQHLALLHLLSQSLELRQFAKQHNLLGQILQVLNQYMIQIHEPAASSEQLLQFDERLSSMLDLQSVPNINQIVIESHNKEHSDVDYEALG